MKTWTALETICDPLEATSVAIGMFDGLHVGHQALIHDAVADARAHGRESAVFTFDRHPAELFAPDRAPGYLGFPAQRDALLAAMGVDHLVVARFDERFRDLSPESFLRFVLCGVLGARAVFVGEDFRFGHDHVGDVACLRDAQERWAYVLHVHAPVLVDGERASSSRIRALLREGDLARALRMLGHPYVLRGTVVRGQQLGRKLGFPTANVELERAQVVPADGVYVVWATVNGRRHKGACSIGVRPAVGGTARTVEVYLLDFAGDLYGQTLDVEFAARLRDEANFETLEALTAQIARDVEQVRALLPD